MNIILGASGQVGSQIVANLLSKGEPVTAVIRDEKKAENLIQSGAKVAVADNLDLNALKKAFEKADTVFLLTPESGADEDVLGKNKLVLENFMNALKSSSVKRLVGLSSIGAQHSEGTGNLLMSYMLENAFSDLDIPQIFVRPAYYMSNWLPYADSLKETGTLPTFFPEDFAISMISPEDVAQFIAEVIADESLTSKVYELYGPAKYTSDDVASEFSKILNTQVKAQQIPRKDWIKTLESLKFSEDGIEKFIEMTEAVIEGKAKAQKTGVVEKKGQTTLSEYFRSELRV